MLAVEATQLGHEQLVMYLLMSTVIALLGNDVCVTGPHRQIFLLELVASPCPGSKPYY